MPPFFWGMPKFPCPNSRYAPGCWRSPHISMVKSTFELLKSKSTRWQAHTDPYVAALRKRLLGAAPEPPVALSNIQMYPAVRQHGPHAKPFPFESGFEDFFELEGDLFHYSHYSHIWLKLNEHHHLNLGVSARSWFGNALKWSKLKNRSPPAVCGPSLWSF